MKKKYSMKFEDQYKHPLWQKKRLEILQKFDFTCFNCGTKDNTLHIHHNYYEQSKKVWEYEEDCYVCLCDLCHKQLKRRKSDVQFFINRFDEQELSFILGFIIAMLMDENNHLGSVDVDNHEVARGIAYYFDKTESTEWLVDRLIDKIKDKQISYHEIIRMAPSSVSEWKYYEAIKEIMKRK